MFFFFAQQTAPVSNALSEAAGEALSVASTNAVYLTDAVRDEVNHGKALVAKMFEWLALNGAQFVLDVIIASVICLVGMYLIRVITFSVRKAIERSGRSNVLFDSFICGVIHKLGWAILLMLILQRLRVNTAPLIAGLGVTGFIVGFACQESLANLASGMMVVLNQPFKVGDFISAGGVDGTVTELNMMATTLLTSDYKRITVPNKVIWGSSITNFSAMDRRRVEVLVGITYGSSIAKAKQVALDTLRAHPLVFADPAPIAEVLSLADSSVNLVLRPWCKPSDYWTVHFEMTRAIKEAFDRNGIAIAFPERVVHLLHETPPTLAQDGDRN